MNHETGLITYTGDIRDVGMRHLMASVSDGRGGIGYLGFRVQVIE